MIAPPITGQNIQVTPDGFRSGERVQVQNIDGTWSRATIDKRGRGTCATPNCQGHRVYWLIALEPILADGFVIGKGKKFSMWCDEGTQ